MVKVETSTNPDLFRRVVGRPDLGLDQASRFNGLNLNKKSLRLNLKTQGGQEVFRRLVSCSDAFVENFRPGVLARLNLDYENLIKFRPDLVMVSISAAGQSGPDSGQPGYAPIFNALGGLGYLTGYSDGPPTEVRDSLDLRVGTVGAYALMMALLHRERTSQGQWVDISAREVTASLIGDAFIERSLSGEKPTRNANASGVPLAAPYDVYRCLGDDCWVAIGVTTDQQWVGLCEAMGRPDLARDPRFADRLTRHENRAELDIVVARWTERLRAAKVARLCRDNGVPSSPLHNGSSLFEDEHVRHRGVLREVQHPHLGSQQVVRGPWQLASRDVDLQASPLLGAHNSSILRDQLAYSDEEIAAFERQGVFE